MTGPVDPSSPPPEGWGEQFVSPPPPPSGYAPPPTPDVAFGGGSEQPEGGAPAAAEWSAPPPLPPPPPPPSAPPPPPPPPPGFGAGTGEAPEPLFAQPTFDPSAEPLPPPPEIPEGFGMVESEQVSLIEPTGDIPTPFFDQPVPPPVAAPASAPAVSAGRAALVKRSRGGSPSQVAGAVVRRYLWVAVVAVVALLVANLLPSARPTVVTAPPANANTSLITLGAGMTPPTAAYASGTTVGGVTCGAGVRQVPWSAYAPPCQPAWHGNNGGATSRGVTGTTIKLTYRAASTSQLAELYGLLPPTVVGTNQEAVNTLQSYINTFNKSFELYGRKVVLVPYNGKGDFINEDLGMDQAQAQEDAVTVAQSIKAFADMSVVDASALYATDLASQNVVATSLYENDDSWYQQYAPWEYSPGPNCTKMAQATGAILGKQLGGLPASFAGDPNLRAKTRVFGMISPLNPEAASCAAADTAAMSAHGQTIAKSVTVKFDLSALIATANAAVAEMKAAGVTTIILSSVDPITPKFYMQAADADNYHPEWWFQSYFGGGQTNNDAFTQLWPADQTQGVIGLGTQTQPLNLQEAVTAFKQGDPTPGAQPVPSFYWDYESILQFFDALQLAGPDLTPANFEAAMRKIPASKPGGMLMGWNGSTGPYDAASQYGVVKYTNNVVSPLDSKPGTYISCDQGKMFSYASSGADVPGHQQMVCAKTAPVQPSS